MTPLRNLLIRSSEVFKDFKRYALADQVINEYIARLPNNTCLKDVLGKVVLINSLYPTAVYDVIKLSRHIASISELDKLIEREDISAVDKMRKGHSIPKKKQEDDSPEDRDLYSFSTKYLNFHSVDAFPIFDNLIKKLLPELNNKYNFYPGKVIQKSLYDYDFHKKVVDALRLSTSLDKESYKRIDQGLWVYAKYRYDPKTVPKFVIEKVEQVEQEVGVSLPPVRKRKKRRKSVEAK